MAVSYSYDGLERLYLDLAVKELHEDPQKICAHIASLRNWLLQSKHIQNCPDDDRFLLKFLRAAKFNHEKAQERLEVFCTLRGSQLHGTPSYFEFPSLEDEQLRYYLHCGLFVPCGFNDRGEQVVLGAVHSWDPDVLSFPSMLPYACMAMEVLLVDERSQIAGVTNVLDLDGFGKKQLNAIMSHQKDLKTWARIWQEGFPMRNGSVYYYREPMIFDILFKVFSFWMKEKLRKRLHRCGTDLPKIHAKMPGAKRILPAEYGGENGTFAELQARFHQRFFDFWRQAKPALKIAIDEAKRPQDSLKLLKEYADYPEDVFGTKGTYTKMDAF